MGLFDFGKKQIKALSAQVAQLQFNQSAAIFGSARANSIAVYPSFDIINQEQRYTGTDDVYSIVRKLSTTAALIPLYGYLQLPDQKAFNRLLREEKKFKEINPRNIKQYQSKALEELPDTDPVEMLLENPNQALTKFELYEAIYSFLFLMGEVFILKERPELGVNAGMPVQLHLLYPQNVITKVSGAFPRQIIGYEYRVNGVLILGDIKASDMIHIKYWNPQSDFMGNELRGLSPLSVLNKRLGRLDSNMNVSTSQLQNGGVNTIVYDKGLMNEGDAVDVIGKRKDNFYRFLKAPSNAGAPYFSSGEMGSINIGSILADMKVIDLANVDFKKLCNVWGVSDILFNSDSASTESNVAIHTKMLYTNTVLPNVYRVRDALVKGLLPDFQNGFTMTNADGTETIIKGDGKIRYIDADLSDITELHEDLGKRATWMASAYWLTQNEKREMMNYERYDDPLFDEPWVPAGSQPLSEFEAMPAVLPAVTPLGN